MRRRRTAAVALLLAASGGAVAALTQDGDDPGAAAASSGAPHTTSPGATVSGTRTTARSTAPSTPTLGATAALGPRTTRTVPGTARTVVVVRGDGPDSTGTTIELYERGDGWRKTGSWHGHLGAHGWTADHREGDLSTPTGTYTLSDAGGRLENPGTRLPYHRSDKFQPTGSGVFGDSLAGSFDYVIAIDYNRRKGVSPLDTTHPLGDDRGGGIWLHVDHDGPTHGCVSVPRAGMQALLRRLDPADHPVVVMGDSARLAT